MRNLVLSMAMQVAIKFIQRGEKMAGRYVEREIVNHSMLLHPHIIQFKEVSPHPLFAPPSVTCNLCIVQVQMSRSWCPAHCPGSGAINTD